MHSRSIGLNHLVPCVLTACIVAGGCSRAPAAQATRGSKNEAVAAVVPRVPAGWPYALDRAPAAGERGMVVTDQPLATEVGIAVLRDGGNAIDAAVATAF